LTKKKEISILGKKGAGVVEIITDQKYDGFEAVEEEEGEIIYPPHMKTSEEEE